MKAVLTIKDEVTGQIPKRLFGQFLERPSWGGEDGPESAVDAAGNLPPAIVAALEQLRPGVLRFPGGTDVDYLDWTILIDRMPGRTQGRPPFHARDGKMVVSSRFGFDEFFRLRDRLGSAAILVVNLLDGLGCRRSVEEAARHAAGLVAYANAPQGARLPEGMPDWPAVRAANGHPEPWNAEYVQLGNETWGFPKELMPKGIASADHYRKVLRAYVAAIRAVDPKIGIIVEGQPGISQVPLAIRNEEWFRRDVRFMAIHCYAPFGKLQIPPERAADPPALWWYRWSGTFTPYQKGIGAPESGFRWAITEWNWNGSGYEKAAAARGIEWRQAAAVSCATFLHGLMRQGAEQVELATQSMLIGQKWGIAAVHYDPKAPDAAPALSAQGQITGLLGRNAGTEMLSCRLDDAAAQLLTPADLPSLPAVPLIDALATRTGKRVTLHLVNRAFDRDAVIRVEGVALHGVPRIEAIVHGALDRGGAVRMEGATLRLPAQTVAAVVVEGD